MKTLINNLTDKTAFKKFIDDRFRDLEGADDRLLKAIIPGLIKLENKIRGKL